MKVEARILDVTSTLEGEKVGMSIDEGALSHIMSVLTDLYSDPELAVIREYSTNAFDAHRDAKLDRPIEVTTPNKLSPFFKVRDFGEGLNAGDIRDIYSRYGASTKRESNDVVGMLGLGCKSALTYTDQFTVVGYKNGICTQVVVSRDENGSGSMTILDQFMSDEESGVEIVIPVKSYNDFEEKAADFFKFWEVGTVLVNGETPDPIDGIWITNDLLLTVETDEPKVVMGNVAYPWLGNGESMRFGYSQTRYNLVAFVGIGDVSFVPSREALAETKKTRETLIALKETFEIERVPALTKLVTDSPTRHEAIDSYFKARALGLREDVVWNGEVIPTKFVPAKIDTVFVNVESNSYYRTKGWTKTVELPSNVEHVWIKGYDSDKFTPTKREKLNQWKAKKNLESKYFIFCGELPDNHQWIDKSKIYDYAEIKAEVLPKKAAVTDGSRPTGSYDAFVGGVSSRGIPADDLSRIELFWVHGSSGSGGYGYHPTPHGLSEILKLHPNATVVTLGANRIAKFERDFPTAWNLGTYLRTKATEWESNISDADRLAWLMHEDRDTYGFLKKLDPKLVNDPVLKKAINISKRDIKKLLDEEVMWSGFICIDRDKLKSPDPFENYRLAAKLYLTNLEDCDISEMYVYFNAVYETAKKG